jgi:hypothetical protein
LSFIQKMCTYTHIHQIQVEEFTYYHLPNISNYLRFVVVVNNGKLHSYPQVNSYVITIHGCITCIVPFIGQKGNKIAFQDYNVDHVLWQESCYAYDDSITIFADD